MPLKDNLFSTSKRYRKADIVDARKWFQGKIKELMAGGPVRGNISDLRARRKVPTSPIGRMVYYKYDPKHKLTLPYYDTFPLTIMLDETKDSFLGMNLHYLPPNLRAIFLGALFNTVNNTKFDHTTHLKVTYQIVKSASKYKYFSACIKRYLKPHIRSRIQYVRPEQWHKAILLPTAQFKKASQATVWKDSRKTWR